MRGSTRQLQPVTTYRQLTPYLRHLWPRLAVTALASVIGGLAEAGFLVLLVQAAVRISGEQGKPIGLGPFSTGATSAGSALLIAGALVLIRLICQLFSVHTAGTVSATAQRALREKLMSAFLHADATAQARGREGELAQLLGGETSNAANAVTTSCNLIASGGTLLMLLSSTFVVDPLAAMLVLGALITLAVVVRPFGTRLRRASSMRADADVDLSSTLVEAVRLSDELRVFGVSDSREQFLQNQAAKVATVQVRVYFLSTSVAQIYQTITIAIMVLGLAAVNAFASDRTANLGAVVLILLRSFAYAQQTQTYIHLLQQSVPSLELIERRAADLIANAVQFGVQRTSSIAQIDVEGVSYSYSPGVPALSDVNFSAATGQVIGIVGPSGAGKSTMAQVLLRLRPPSSGHYLIDKMPASQLSVEDWSRLVSYVPQDPKLLTNTVAENIRFFREDNFSVEIAARAAHIHDEILSWADGYDTQIGQRGNTISGGQRQRICLARALYAKPQLLVLDEATSALDARSEELIQRSLTGLKGKATVIIIAHRPSTLAVCDRILVFEKGALIASDSLEELVKTNSYVAHMLGAPTPLRTDHLHGE